MSDFKQILYDTLAPYAQNDQDATGKHAAFCMGLMNDRFAGRLKQEDINEVFTRLYRHRYEEKTRLFFMGKLFAAQTQNFDQWLAGSGIKDDQERYDEFAGVAFLCGANLDSRIITFANKRLFSMGHKDKQAIQNPKHDWMRTDALKTWSDENRFNHWEWAA